MPEPKIRAIIADDFMADAARDPSTRFARSGWQGRSFLVVGVDAELAAGQARVDAGASVAARVHVAVLRK